MYPGPPPQWGPPPPWGPPPRPPGPSVGWAVALWVAMACCLFGALVCGGLAVIGYSFDHRIDAGVTTTATVTAVSDTVVTVEFVTEDAETITTDFIWWPSEYPDVGDRIDITYNPDDPYYVVAAGSKEDQIMAFVFSAGAAVALVAAAGAGIGAVLVHRARR